MTFNGKNVLNILSNFTTCCTLPENEQNVYFVNFKFLFK